MDPTACYQELQDLFEGLHKSCLMSGPLSNEATESRRGAIERLLALASWLEKGGYPPNPS